jgi:hypothetical protein
MTKDLYTLTQHNTYGGEIELDDFNTYYPNKNRINNQMIANNAQIELEKKKKQKREDEKYKSMTFEELKEMKIVSNTNGRPLPSLTDEKWQKEFNVRKLFVRPIPPDSKIKKMNGRYSKEYGIWNEERQGEYHGCTNYQQYCSFINDVLENIRGGQVDYCYYIYQIMDLLRFHYHDLRTRYCDCYWEVWLDK